MEDAKKKCKDDKKCLDKLKKQDLNDKGKSPPRDKKCEKE